MWGSIDPFAQIKKRNKGIQRKRRQKFNKYGWGSLQKNSNNNNGWGNNNNNNNGWGNQANNNNGWGNQTNNNNNNNDTNNNGWGNDSNNNNGWGNQANNNNGWGNQANNNNNNNNNTNNNGWGNDSNNNNGWGNQANNNNGWGNINNNNNNNNNGWGNENNNNDGWGNQNNNKGGIWGNALKGVNWMLEMRKKHQGNISPFNMEDIKNILEEQIVLIEPSPHKQKLQQLKKNGQVFKDDRFPPNQQSLSGEWGYVSEWKQIKWTPISQGIPSAKIFVNKPQPRDIHQGYLGDCYFLAALAALAERPDRIFQLFLLTETNQQKYYSVKMLYQGKWMTVDMDQHIPFLHGKPAFTKAKQNQLWVVLLQKAWAKLYSNYKRIQAGYPQEGLHDLTGAPIRQISLQGGSFNKQKEWDYLLDASKREYSMVSSSQPGSDTNKSVSGVVQGHAYTFLQAVNMNFQGNQVRLVQLRNPWGKGQFQGKWSDYDKKWNSVDAAQKARIGFNPNKEDGIFFMSYDDYCKQFRALTIAQIDDNASYIYKSHKDPQNKGCYFKVKIYKAGNYSFHVDKTPERSYQDSKQNSFTYPITEIQIGHLQGNSVSEKKGTNSSRRTLYYDIDIAAGDHIVFVRTHYDKHFQKDFDVNLAIYAQFPCQIKLASKKQAVAFSGNPNVDWSGQQTKYNTAWNQLQGYGIQSQIKNNDGWDQQDRKNQGWNASNNKNQGQANNYGWGHQSSNNEGYGNGQSNNGWGNNNNYNDGW